MPQNTSSTQTLWNEGRVVGLSAYEVYVKQHELEDPTTPPASEREWLSSSLAAGASLLVHVVTTSGIEDDENHVIQIPLPDATKLCAANTIVGSFFYGDAEDNGDNFAQYVKDYGQLISNNSSSAPANGSVDAVNIPYVNPPAEISDIQLAKLAGYMRILDGVILQSGNWTDSGLNKPNKDFEPNQNTLSTPPVLRLQVKGPIKTDFWILLSGFTMRSVLQGETKLEGGCIRTDNPSDGDFLGPQVYPWANKVVFSVPTAAVRYDSLYTRKIASNDMKTLQDSAIIDMRDTDPADYYNSNFSNTRVALNVNKFVTMRDNTAVLTVYQRDTDYAPALFGTFVKTNGQQHLNPIDTVAPRTLKFFHSESAETAADFEASIPQNFALIRNGTTYKLQQVGPNKDAIPVADATVAKDSNSIYRVSHTHGTQTVKSIAITDASGKDLPLTGAAGTLSVDELTWNTMLNALGINKKIDILGGLKVFKKVIEDFLKADGEPGKQYVIEITDDGKIVLVEFNAVDFTIEKYKNTDDVWAQHLVLGDGAKDARTISLQNNAGKLFNINPTDPYDVLDNPIPDGTLTWQYMLQALGKEKRIDSVGTTLRRWRSALDDAPTTDVYSVAVDKDGPHLVPTAKFPNFVRETVLLQPHGTQLYSRMILDVFGYIQDTVLSDGSVQKTANMMCTLSCFTGSGGAAGTKICQRFKIPATYQVQWNNILKWLAVVAGVGDGSTVPTPSSGYNTVLFNSLGRSIYKSSYPVGSPVDQIRMAGYFPLSTEDTTGILYMAVNSYGWGGSAGCVSSAAYQGSLALTQASISASNIPNSGAYSG